MYFLNTNDIQFQGSSRSTPTPVPMVVAKSSHSSWTLVPGDRNYNSTSKKVPAYKKIPGDNAYAAPIFLSLI